MSFVELTGWCSHVVSGWPPGVLVLEPFMRGSGTDQVSYYLCPGWGCFLGDTIGLQLAAAYAGPEVLSVETIL